MASREIVATKDVQVRIMELEVRTATEWHHHSEVNDFFVCLTGTIQIETNDGREPTVLHPGERAEIRTPRVHRVVNLNRGRSEYLLVQGVGKYDFVRDAV